MYVLSFTDNRLVADIFVFVHDYNALLRVYRVDFYGGCEMLRIRGTWRVCLPARETRSLERANPSRYDSYK